MICLALLSTCKASASVGSADIKKVLQQHGYLMVTAVAVKRRFSSAINDPSRFFFLQFNNAGKLQNGTAVVVGGRSRRIEEKEE